MAELEQLRDRQPVQTGRSSVAPIEEQARGAIRNTTSHFTKDPRQGSVTYRFHGLPMEGDALEALRGQIVAESKSLPESVTEIVIDLSNLKFITGGGFAVILWSLPKSLQEGLPKKRVRLVGIHPHVKHRLETLQISPHIPATLEYAEAAETSSETAS